MNDIRKKFGTRRVGHAGTLDPLATGLLVVAVGPATRFLQYLPLEPKQYTANITFGRATSTYDAEGQTSFEGPVPDDLAGAIESALPRFRGLIQQLPPMYSAVKLGGKPLYKYAREGQEIRRETRTVHITAFDVLEVTKNACQARIVCSGGTYIRSLAHDLGQDLGCGAHLSALVRTSVGRFALEDAVLLAEAAPQRLLSLRESLPPMPLHQLDATQTENIREGRPIQLDEPQDHFLAALLDPAGNVFSVARVVGNMLHPECVIPAEAPFASS